MLHLDGETLAYGKTVVLSQVDFHLRPGERVVLLGRSGSGKTTLLSAAYSRLADQMSEQIALVPQETGLVPQLSVFHNVYVGQLDAHGAGYNLLNLIWPQKAQRRQIDGVLQQVGLEGLSRQPVAALSGGQKQRVALARAMHRGGNILMADEPVSAVDERHAAQLIDTLATRFGTMLLSLHDVALARRVATRIVGIKAGRLMIDKPAAELSGKSLMPSTVPDPRTLRRPGRLGISLGFLLLAIALLPVADLGIAGHDPWGALSRMGAGLLSPDFGAISALAYTAALTVAFAICGVAAGATAGFLLAPFYHRAPVRLICVAIRAIYELFWALLLMQVTGLSATTGILAIAIPYTGIFAKVFAEYLDEADPRPARAISPRSDAISRFFYARLPLAAREFGTYTRYRLECALRSSAVLGFVGLPTLGFQLDTFFKQGIYGAVAAVLIIYYLLIATMRIWMRRKLVPVYLVAAVGFLATLHTPPMGQGALIRFLTQDIVPAPLRNADLAQPATWQSFGDWLQMLSVDQALPGLAATLIVAQLSLVLAGIVALIGLPLILRPITGRFGALLGHLVLVIGRSTPEYMLAYIMLQVFGPSMLPAVIALGLHNGAIIAHLMGQQSQHLATGLRPDAPRGISLYLWELLPRTYGNFLALCFYRWEIIIRKSAIVGLLGISTIGFYIGTAI